MTLADYSVSDVVFDNMDHWKNVLAETGVSNNNTEALTELVQLLDEFIDIARSESRISSTVGLVASHHHLVFLSSGILLFLIERLQSIQLFKD